MREEYNVNITVEIIDELMPAPQPPRFEQAFIFNRQLLLVS